MSSTVTARMNTCGKTNTVIATLQDDGAISIEIISDCPNVQEYAKRLGAIAIKDVTEFKGSKVIDPEIRATLSVPCLTPIAVFDAAWLEIGMLAKSRAHQVKENSISFE
jgi:hypothetical protein